MSRSEYLKEYRRTHKEQIAKQRQEYNKRNRERINERQKQWRHANPDKVKQYEANRKAKKGVVGVA